MSAVATDQGGRVIPLPDPPGVGEAAQLASIFGITDLGLGIQSVDVFGRTASASANITLTDGTRIEFPSLIAVSSPRLLCVELAAQAGATPTIKGPMAIKAVALIRSIARYHDGHDLDQCAREWGTTFLQAANVLDVDLTDRAQRWAAFSRLEKVNPWYDVQAGHAATVAAGCVVLRDQATDARLVRAGWLRAHVRSEGERISDADLSVRMARVGWERRGKSGRIKATCPGFNRPPLAWNFWEIPAGWEDQE